MGGTSESVGATTGPGHRRAPDRRGVPPTSGGSCNWCWPPSGCSTASCSCSPSCSRGSSGPPCWRRRPTATRARSPTPSPGRRTSSPTTRSAPMPPSRPSRSSWAGDRMAPQVKVGTGGIDRCGRVAVWWFGEGLGRRDRRQGPHRQRGPGGGADLRRARRGALAGRIVPAPDPSCTAARAVGERAARLIWVVLWGGLAFFALLGANRSADGLRRPGARTWAPGEPAMVGLPRPARRRPRSATGAWPSRSPLRVVLGAIALSVYLPLRPARVMVGGGRGAWPWSSGSSGENFGEVFSGSATDPNTGPLLALFGRGVLETSPTGARGPRHAAGSRTMETA